MLTFWLQTQGKLEKGAMKVRKALNKFGFTTTNFILRPSRSRSEEQLQQRSSRREQSSSGGGGGSSSSSSSSSSKQKEEKKQQQQPPQPQQRPKVVADADFKERCDRIYSEDHGSNSDHLSFHDMFGEEGVPARLVDNPMLTGSDVMRNQLTMGATRGVSSPKWIRDEGGESEGGKGAVFEANHQARRFSGESPMLNNKVAEGGIAAVLAADQLRGTHASSVATLPRKCSSQSKMQMAEL